MGRRYSLSTELLSSIFQTSLSHSKLGRRVTPPLHPPSPSPPARSSRALSQVISKHNNDTQHVWESAADGKFTLAEDKDGPALGRGTQINIYLKEEAAEYLEE